MGGGSPLTIPPLERFEVSDSLQNGGVIESDKLICGGCGGCCDRLFYDDVPIQVPPVAESHCKFRL